MITQLVWRNLWQKPLQSLLCMALIAAGVALAVLTLRFAEGVRQGLTQAVEPFELVAGAKGSPNQLLLNAVFLQDTPAANADYTLVERLAANPLVAEAIPLGFGDNYRGWRVVGTEETLFAHSVKPGGPPWLTLAAGRAFAGEFEAVLGASVAAREGLAVGDRIETSHGAAHSAAAHAEGYSVVGILKPLGGPYDSGVFVPLTSLWQAHTKPGMAEKRGVTAVLLRPKGYGEALALYGQLQRSADAQLIFPAQTIVQLFAVLGEGEKILRAVAGGVCAMALLAATLSLYWAAASRARERAVLRALGASERYLLALVFGEGVCLLTAGLFAGVCIGGAAFWLLAGAVEVRSALSLTGGSFASQAVLLGVVYLSGLAASLTAAARSAKAEIAAEL